MWRDVIVSNVVTEAAALSWLRFQWFGIAFLPAAYIQFSDAVLRNTGSDLAMASPGSAGLLCD